ncbi:MAG: translation initiation factor IF-2 [Candidatus Abawacabacteria bacterium]|nr:translation initiation factor IF-2 [Candidatus Abawacabacteria bacterium]
MDHKLATVAKEFGITEKKLRTEVASLGVKLTAKSTNIDDKTYQAVQKKLSAAKETKKKTITKKVTTKKAIKKTTEKKVVAKKAPVKKAAKTKVNIVESEPPVATAEPEEEKKTVIAETKLEAPVEESVAAGTPEEKPAEANLPQIALPLSITVKDFASLLKVGVNQVISELFKNGFMANINQRLDFDIAAILAQEFGFEAVAKGTEEPQDQLDLGVLLEDKEENLTPRSPVISVMGHVDHGKTKLLDTIRGTTVMEGEAGGITQKIGAYQIRKQTRDGEMKTITFLDTPGHQAFTAMRARGAKVTDIAILVVAADDGVKPQTIEAYEHAKAAGVPVVVAITKIDKEGANVDRVKAQLAEIGLAVEEWGGSTVCAEVSAVQKKGIDELLELVLLVADMQDLKANPKRKAIGTIIESRVDQGQGALATVLIHTGTLRLRDDVVIGDVSGKIRSMVNDRGEKIIEAGPSYPVLITGMSKAPQVGDVLRVVADKREALNAVQKSARDKQVELLSGISQSSKKEGVKELKVVIKADTKGSLEALRNALLSLPAEKVAVKIIYAGLGNTTSSDVMIAAAGHGSIFGFNILTPISVQKSADIEKVKITTFTVIYHLLDEVQKVLLSMVEPEIKVTVVGKLKVLKIFFDGKGEQVVGGEVTQGKVVSNTTVKVYRGENVVGEMELKTVKEGPEEVKEVVAPTQCGMKLMGNIKIAVGDVIECYVKEKVIASLT